MKKFKLLLVLGLILVSITVVGCKKKKNNSTIINMNSDTNLLGFYSLSSAKILTETSQSQTRNIRTKNLSQTQNEIDMDVVNSYMQMMESMFSESAPLVTKNEASDKPEFQYKLVFEATDLSGKKEVYTIYYKQTEIIEKDRDLEDKYENEVEYRLEGLAIIEGLEYQISGEKETEDGEESLDIVVKLDEKNYVIIEQEVENNEQEYEYEIIKDGRKYKSISFEVERGKEFEAEFITNENGYKEKYRFYKEGNIVKIQYQSREKVFTIKATASIDHETNETVYTYKVMESNQEYKFKD